MRISDWSSDVCSSDLFDCPAMIDTDVNGAALAELRWGAGARGEAPSDTLCYITIGTGVGGGSAFNAHTVHGAMLPEIGTIIRKSAGWGRRGPGRVDPGVPGSIKKTRITQMKRASC